MSAPARDTLIRRTLFLPAVASDHVPADRELASPGAARHR
jgi:hypothetical protein